MKEKYLKIMELALSAYSLEHVKKYFNINKSSGLTEHGFPRLTANIGILIANGKYTDYTPLFVEMMDFCCSEIPKKQAANDFSVKEILLSIFELKKLPSMRENVQRWLNMLRAINPYECYTCIAPTPDTRVGNWAAYNAASEFLREYAGLCASEKFIDDQICSQLLSFDENGMYRDQNEPMLYDLAVRCQMALLLHFGYSGKYREQIDNNLKKSALFTLQMQSVTGEIPYGGRSNQFLFNEAYFAACCEFEASRYLRDGNISLAGEFRDASLLAISSIQEYLNQPGKEKHVKNHYPKFDRYGCEGYAYFDKYMISVASFIYLAFLFCDDSIVARPCPARLGGYTFQTSDYFHKIFCSYGGYFAEWDTNADPHYDASGLGRIQYTGAPANICLSTPA